MTRESIRIFVIVHGRRLLVSRFLLLRCLGPKKWNQNLSYRERNGTWTIALAKNLRSLPTLESKMSSFLSGFQSL